MAAGHVSEHALLTVALKKGILYSASLICGPKEITKKYIKFNPASKEKDKCILKKTTRKKNLS